MLLSSSNSSVYWVCWSYQSCFLCLSDIYLMIFIWLLCLICLMYLMTMILLNDIILSHCLFTVFLPHFYSYLLHLPHPTILLHYDLLMVTLWVINLAKSSTDSSIDSNTVALSQNLLCLSDHCVLIVYQLKQFKLMNHVYAFLISNDIVDLVYSIVNLYSIFTDYQSSADMSGSQQICENYSQFIDLDYFISWSLTKNSFIKVIHHFRENSKTLLNHSAFLMWTSFETILKEDSDQSDSFRTEQRLCWFIILIFNKLNLFMTSLLSESDQSHKSSFSKICSHTSISIETISCDPSLFWNMIDNNKNESQNSNHKTSVVNSVFSEAQMQMLWNIMT